MRANDLLTPRRSIARTHTHYAWHVPIGSRIDTHFIPTPIVYRGVIYVTTAYATIALDAVSCRSLWRHERKSKIRERRPHNGGVAVKSGKVIRGTRDGYLLALEAQTGRV